MFLRRRVRAAALQHLLSQELLDGEPDQLQQERKPKRLRALELPVGRRRHAAVQADGAAPVLAGLPVCRDQQVRGRRHGQVSAQLRRNELRHHRHRGPLPTMRSG